LLVIQTVFDHSQKVVRPPPLTSRQPSAVIADDSTVAREGIAAIIHRDLGYTLCGLATNERATREMMEKHQPDLLVLEPFLGHHALFEAIALIVLVVLVFLQTWRAALIPLIAVIFLFPLYACGQSTTGLNEDSRNLIPNGSFEQDGRATLDTWQVANSSLASLTREAAPGGGQWSVRLQADWAPTTGQVRFPVPKLKDGDTVRLSAYIRASDERGGGLIGVQVTAADGRLRQESFASSKNTRWTQVSVTKTLSLEQGDTVWVVLRSPPTELESRAGLFDLVMLERVDEQ
jgi:Carbohydrate binding domain